MPNDLKWINRVYNTVRECHLRLGSSLCINWIVISPERMAYDAHTAQRVVTECLKAGELGLPFEPNILQHYGDGLTPPRAKRLPGVVSRCPRGLQVDDSP